MQELIEGGTTFVTNSEKKISKEMPVFYNPVMKLNRDLSLLVLSAMPNKPLRIGLPMEASGVRAARIVNELVKPGILKPDLIAINDLSEEAIDLANKNIKLQKTKCNVEFSTTEANLFLRQSRGFEYIDIDPFGTPNPFLESAVKRITKDGIIAVTATDTSALAGTYPGATAKKYWSVPSRTWAMHEWGIRILIRKVQLIAAQFEKVLVPVLSVSADHYYRVFFRSARGVPLKDILKQHKFVHINTATMEMTISEKNFSECEVAGPLWTGDLHDKKFVDSVILASEKLDTTFHDAKELLKVIRDECSINAIGFIELNELFSRLKRPTMKKIEILEKLGKKASRTHFSQNGIKTSLSTRTVLSDLGL